MLPAPLRGPSRRLRHSLLATGLTYAAGVLGYMAFRPALGERTGWIELADDFEPWACAPAPLALLAGIVTGSTPLTLAATAVLAAFAGRWGGRFLRPAAPASEPADLTVVTFNTLAWQRDGHDLADVIAHLNPDLVGLQEIGPRAADDLIRRFADRFRYHFVSPSASSSGAAVLSRYPLGEPLAFRASEHGHWWQRFIVETPRGPITYINLHTKIPHMRTTHRKAAGVRIPLEFHAERRRDEVRELVRMLDGIDGPIIVGGDFNMTERSPDYRLLATRLMDGYRAVGVGLGHTFPRLGAVPTAFPAPFPLLRLDYIWHSRHFQTSWARVGPAGKSDHHPVVVGLRWADDAARPAGLPLAASTV